MSATVCLNDGDTHNSPSEQAEAKFPIVVESFGSTGFRRRRPPARRARHRRITRALTPVTVNTQIERSHCPPWGLEGGGDATGNKVALRLGGNGRPIFPTPRCWWRSSSRRRVPHLAPAAAAATARRSSGRPGMVHEDVRQGYVSVEAAAERTAW